MANDRRGTERLAELLKRQFSNEIMRRHLRGLPIFRLERRLPNRLRELLDRLARRSKR